MSPRRLTPPYMIILGAHTALFKYTGSGPFWPDTGMELDCPNSWWANLLYLNNVIDKHSQVSPAGLSGQNFLFGSLILFPATLRISVGLGVILYVVMTGMLKFNPQDPENKAPRDM